MKVIGAHAHEAVTLSGGSLRANRYLAPILGGLLIAAAGTAPWALLARLNARVRPDVPWAALTTLAYLAVLLVWLNGWGPPRKNAAERRWRLRLWPAHAPERGAGGGLSAAAIVALLGLLTVVWVVIGRMSPMPDLNAYPTTVYRWSVFLMGGITAGVVEEAAFRGYMQTGLERFDPERAIWITSLAFVAAHITHGIGAVLLLGPGFFVVSLLYGTLARRTGTILPGMAIHAIGDLAYVYFGLLRGDGRLLFAGP